MSSSGGRSITVESLGKRYLLGQRAPYKTLRESMASLRHRRCEHAARAPVRRSLWALRGLNLEVGCGEALGVIGQNGAGKSTLLKILSRVTTPTEGRAVLRGRHSALLEVGTGFHPELTGRENVYLNGSILGMRRSDISARFADIVDFSEIGEFIETPLKRYSTGMQVRLAFAVAAFLEPEILIVDEVLAVGDVAFQRKCLNQLGASSSAGRTVLFVSHNLQAVKTLCTRAIVLDHGALMFDGATDSAVAFYLARQAESGRSWDLRSAQRPALDMGGRVKFRQVELEGTSEGGALPIGQALAVRMEFEVNRSAEDIVIVLNVSTLDGTLVAQSVTANVYPPMRGLSDGVYAIAATLPSTMLQPGTYVLGVGARSSRGLEDQVEAGGSFEIVEAATLASPFFAGLGGYVRLPVDWAQPVKLQEPSERG